MKHPRPVKLVRHIAGPGAPKRRCKRLLDRAVRRQAPGFRPPIRSSESE